MALLRAVPVLVLILGAFLNPLSAQGTLRVEGPFPPSVELGQRATIQVFVADPAAEIGPMPTPGDHGLRPASVQDVAGGRRWVIEIEPRRVGRIVIPPLPFIVGTDDAAPLRTEPTALEVTTVAAARENFAVRVEIPSPVWVGQEFSVRLLIEHDRAFVREALLQPFRTPLALPLRIDVPWMDRLPETGPATVLGGDPGDVQTNFVLNGAQVRGRLRPAADEARSILVVERRLLARAADYLVLDDGLIRFAFATEFTEDFIRGRIPRNRRPGAIGVTGPHIEIRELPLRGRPEGFSGAVGAFQVQARLVGEAPKEPVEPGTQVRVRLRVRGAGSIPRPPLPPADSISGFRALGIVPAEDADSAEKKGTEPTERDFLLDLVAVSGARSLGAIPWPYFDPARGAYRVARTNELPVAVRGPIAEKSAADEAATFTDVVPGPGRDALEDIVPFDAKRHRADADAVRLEVITPDFVIRAFGLVVLFISLALLFRERWRMARDPEMRARAAYRNAQFTRDLDDIGRWLGRRLGRGEACLHDRDLEGRLREAGAPTEDVARMLAAVREVQASRYAESGAPDDDGLSAEVALPSPESLTLEPIEAALRGPTPWPSFGRMVTAGVLFALSAVVVTVQLMPREKARFPRLGDDVASEPTGGARVRLGGGRGELPAAGGVGGIFAPVDGIRGLLAADALARWEEGDRGYRAGRFTEAYLGYRRAAFLRPDDEDLLRNLELTRAAMGRPERGPRGFAALFASLGDLLAGYGGIVLAVILATIGGARLLVWRRWRDPLAWILLAAGIALIGHVYGRVHAAYPPAALVVEDGLALRSEPGPRAPVRRELDAATDLGVLEGSARWLRVRLPDGTEGWVPARGIRGIDFRLR